ncbi:MAG: sulfotransferase family 2 domain-containing protein [Pseudomonadota bacterium]
MVSHQNKCIYVHLPKVAGTSISKALEDSDADKKHLNLKPFLANDFKFSPPPPHYRISDYLQYEDISQQQFDSYFKFSFVRNPWDRLVSEYKYRHHARKITFKDFIFNYFPQPSWSDEYCHIIPQYDFLYDENGTKLVDYIGKFENLQNDFNEVCKILEIPPIILSHSNSSQNISRRRTDIGICELLKKIRDKLSWTQKLNTFKHYSEYYDIETQQYVADLYKNDVETFQYTFTQSE